MKNSIRRLILGAVVLALSIAPVLPACAETDPDPNGWKFIGEVYLWGPAIKGETAAGDDFEISLSDILHNLDMAFMGKLGASKGKWQFVGDFIYLDLEGDTTGTANIIGHPEKTKTDLELTSYVGALEAGYAVIETTSTRINLMLGARYLYLKADAKFHLGGRKTRISDSGDNVDGIVGVSGITHLNAKWFLTYYADVGTGESDLTWQVSAAVGYRFDKFDTVLGYRYLDYEFDDDSEIIDNLNIGGPFVGLRYRF